MLEPVTGNLALHKKKKQSSRKVENLHLTLPVTLVLQIA